MMQKLLRSQISKNLFKRTQVRAFSGFQTDMEKFDFTDKLNVQELKLKEPTNL